MEASRPSAPPFERPQPQGEIDLAGVLRALWSGRWIIAGASALCVAISAVVVFMLPDVYRASVTLMPASGSATSRLSQVAGQFSGLAALAGLDTAMSGETRQAEAAVAMLKSWAFQEDFIRSGKYEVAVLAAKGWDRATDTLEINTSRYDPATGIWAPKWRRAPDDAATPSGWRLHEKFAKRINVREDDDAGFYVLNVDFYSPHLAAEWTQKLVASVNRELQERDRQEFRRSLEYLQDHLSRTQLTEMRVVLAKLIEEQTKNLMLADVSEEYVFKMLTPVMVPEKPVSPRRLRILALAAVMGALGAALAWCLYLNLRS